MSRLTAPSSRAGFVGPFEGATMRVSGGTSWPVFLRKRSIIGETVEGGMSGAARAVKGRSLRPIQAAVERRRQPDAPGQIARRQSA